jgi:hypothetical protein
MPQANTARLVRGLISVQLQLVEQLGMILAAVRIPISPSTHKVNKHLPSPPWEIHGPLEYPMMEPTPIMMAMLSVA